MKNAFAEFQSLRRAWEILRKSRPSETDFTPFGLKGGDASDFDALFEEWETALSNAASKTRTLGGDDKALESIIVTLIGQLLGLVTAAPSNGYPWLFQSGFPAKLSELNVSLTPVLDRRFRVRKAVIAAAQEDLNNDISRVESAAPLADRLVDQQAKISAQSEEVGAALQSVKAAATEATDATQKITEYLKSVQQIDQDATAAKVTYDETIESARKLLKDADAELDTIKADRETADEKIVEGTDLLATANEKISKAIADLNRQGLAGSFASSARRLGKERMAWLIAFIVAIGYLVCIASSSFSGELGSSSSLTDLFRQFSNNTQTKAQGPSFLVRVLHFLPFIAPGIWLGWFAARNASLTARIQQDYTYKAVTAQSFEAYKKEVEASGDRELVAKLLETTIRNFGDNPIRIYDGTGFEGHPLESLKSVMDDKQFDKLIKLLDALKPSLK
jgi:hypothetical protein